MHVTIHAAPGMVSQSAEPFEIEGAQIEVLAIDAADLPPLAVSFEEAAERLSALPRMFFEPDGSFVWVSETDPPWQLDGQLQDRGPALDYVEIKGNCAAASWEAFLGALGWPQHALVFQIVRAGRFVDAANVCKLLLIEEQK
jgi:hypothetical protein